MTSDNELWLIDGYNVLHAVVLGRVRDVAWWRRDYQQQVLDWVLAYFVGPAPEQRVVLVFDASRDLCREEVVVHEWVEVVYAPDADEWMVQCCLEAQGLEAQCCLEAQCLEARREHEHRSVTRIVTADRALTNRARAHGATVLKPWELSVALATP